MAGITGITIDQLKTGIRRYIDEDILPHTTGLMRIGAATYLSLAMESGKIDSFIDAPFIKALDVVDESGRIDIDRVYKAVSDNLGAGEKVDVDVPLLGHILFSRSDLERIVNLIKQS